MAWHRQFYKLQTKTESEKKKEKYVHDSVLWIYLPNLPQKNDTKSLKLHDLCLYSNIVSTYRIVAESYTF